MARSKSESSSAKGSLRERSAPAKGSIPRERILPEKHNPLLSEAKTPPYDELVSRRRLGRTDLQVKAEQIGTTNATKKENLGTIEYAYLGAPLPEDLEGSETFPPAANAPPPEEYFMMRRSRDGFVSATGMFKVAFPWAKHAEEKAERDYLQTLETTSADEQAGNIWINETAALDLADDYNIRQWIVALLDPAHPSTEPHKRTTHAISPPPKFEFKAGGSNGKLGSPDLPPPATPSGKGSKRGKRSQSPSKLPKAASPRKRLTKAAKEASANAAKAASESLQTALDTAASVADSESVAGTEIDAPKTNGVSASSKGDVVMDGADEDKVTVQVESTVKTNGDIETTHTNVKVQMPADSPELPLPETTEEMIATAKQMVEEARKLEGEGEGAKVKGKRKAAEALEDEEDDEIAAQAAEGRELQPAKKARLMEQEVRTQKVRSRALMGVAATLTIGAILPYFIGA